MSRVQSSSSASTVGIKDTAGNALTSSNGALDVNANLANGFDTLAIGPTQVTIGLTSSLLLDANPNRKYAHISNNSGQTIFIQYQAGAVLNQGIKIPPNALYTIESNNLWLGTINAIGVTAGQLIDILEGE